MDNQFLKWVRVISQHPDLKANFEAWIGEVIRVYENRALWASHSFDECLGLRYAAGEFLALRELVQAEDNEIMRLRQNVS